MRHSKQTRDVDPHQPRLRNARRSDTVANPGVGDQFIGPSGRIWTIQSVVSTARRFVLTRPTDDGVATAVVDLGALANMARLNSVNAAAPATGFSRAPSRPRLTAPTLSHVARGQHSPHRCHRRRLVIHLRFDEAHHSHVDTYESMPV